MMNSSLAPSLYSHQQKIKKNLLSHGFDMRPQFIDWAKGLTPQEKRLLETLFDFVQEKTGWHGIYPSVKTLAWRSQMSLRNCHRVKTSLKAKGYIDWVTVRDQKTKQLKCHFAIKEKVLELKQRERGERYALPQLVNPFFDLQKGGDRLSQPVVSDCHTNKYIKLPSEAIKVLNTKWAGASRPREQPLENSFCLKTPVGGEGRGASIKSNSESVLETFESENFETENFKTGKQGEGNLRKNPPPQSPPALAGPEFSDAQREALSDLLGDVALPKYLRKTGKLVKMELDVNGVRARVQVPVHMVGQTLAELSGAAAKAARKGRGKRGNPQEGEKTALKANKRKADKISPVVLKEVVPVEQAEASVVVSVAGNAEVKQEVIEETKSMNELPFSKAKQVGRESTKELSREEKQKLKAKEYRKKHYERQKEKLNEMKENGTAFKRPVSKKMAEKHRDVSKIFQFFLARCKERNLEPHSSDLNQIDLQSGVYMLERFSVAEAEIAFTWALDHWDMLLEKDDRLSRAPYFYNLTAYHRVQHYLRKATVDSIQATKAEQMQKETGALIGNNRSKGLRVAK